jgi:hypothetical protein
MWECAKKTYEDQETNFVFNPNLVVQKGFSTVQVALTKYKLALQKEKQTQIWITLCQTIVDLYEGDIRKLFIDHQYSVEKIKKFIQIENKKLFPYLSGNKICNYWLYVIYQYTNCIYNDIDKLTVAPDTHVIKATHKLGLISDLELTKNDVQTIVAKRWEEVLLNTKYHPIDIHTPLWLWSRSNFKDYKINGMEYTKDIDKETFFDEGERI